MRGTGLTYMNHKDRPHRNTCISLEQTWRPFTWYKQLKQSRTNGSNLTHNSHCETYSQFRHPWLSYIFVILLSTYHSIRACSLLSHQQSGFGGLQVACRPLVPKFAGSNPTEAVGFSGRKKSSSRLPLKRK